MLAVTTSFAIPDFNSCSVTATPPLDRPRTTLTSVFTGPGVRAANPAIRRVPHSTTLLRRAFRATHRASVVAEGVALNISIRDVTLLGHAAFGVTGCLAALWVFVEALNAKPGNAVRIRAAALMTAVSMAAAWICGGYWYVH